MRLRVPMAFVCLCLSAAAWRAEATSPSASKAPAAALRHDSTRCTAHPEVDVCYDAIRWYPNDPTLLVALGDALLRAHRPADAMRNYRRAAALMPNLRGVAAKITAAEAKLPAVRSRGSQPVERLSTNALPGKRFSNAAPETQSH
jgi:hypothetical protein